jgi:hypothetical protein
VPVDRDRLGDGTLKPGGVGAVLHRRPVRADVGVECAVVEHVVGMPLGASCNCGLIVTLLVQPA